MNSIFLISPYKHNGMWVFDDPARDLVKEPFVAGADTVIDIATALVPGAEHGFNLLFADFPFPGHQIVLTKEDVNVGLQESDGEILFGTDYICEQLGVKAWLCPALNKYYPISPDKIYASFNPITGLVKTKHNKNESKEKTSSGSKRERRQPVPVH